MAIYVKNIDTSSQVIRGRTVAVNAYLLVPEAERPSWAADSDLYDRVSSDLIMFAKADDGLNDITDYAEQWAYLGNLVPPTVDLKNKTSVSGIPKVALYKGEGSSGSIASHDWTDPCTWYNDSTRVTGETLTLDTGKIYDMVNSNIIDLKHGRVSDEDLIVSTYEVKVYDNGTEVTEDTDYTVDYENGKITFDAAYTVTGPVTADYSYENGSTFILKPDSGKVLNLEHAEIQVTKNIQMNSSFIDFDIWVYNPQDLPNKMLYKRKRYKNIKDILNSANLGQGSIHAVDTFTNEILIFPFNYITTQSLLDSQGTELRISISDDQPLTGEWATTTFYITSEDE